jgi:hypothetical protein
MDTRVCPKMSPRALVKWEHYKTDFLYITLLDFLLLYKFPIKLLHVTQSQILVHSASCKVSDGERSSQDDHSKTDFEINLTHMFPT